MPSEWIKHDGGGRPVPLGQLVETKCRCGESRTDPCEDWAQWRWNSFVSILTGHWIVEYRTFGGDAFNILRDVALNAKADAPEVVP